MTLDTLTVSCAKRRALVSSDHLPMMRRRQMSMMASAPMLILRICSSCMSSQLSPEKPLEQRHEYRSTVSRLMHVPPLWHGLSRHSLRSTHDLPSGVTRWPRGHLAFLRGGKRGGKNR